VALFRVTLEANNMRAMLEKNRQFLKRERQITKEMLHQSSLISRRCAMAKSTLTFILSRSTFERFFMMF